MVWPYKTNVRGKMTKTNTKLVPSRARKKTSSNVEAHNWQNGGKISLNKIVEPIGNN